MVSNPPRLNGEQVTIVKEACFVNSTLCNQAMTSTPINQMPSYLFMDAVHPSKTGAVHFAKEVEMWMQSKGWATLN